MPPPNTPLCAKVPLMKAPLVQRGVGFAQQNSGGLFEHTANLMILKMIALQSLSQLR